MLSQILKVCLLRYTYRSCRILLDSIEVVKFFKEMDAMTLHTGNVLLFSRFLRHMYLSGKYLHQKTTEVNNYMKLSTLVFYNNVGRFIFPMTLKEWNRYELVWLCLFGRRISHLYSNGIMCIYNTVCHVRSWTAMSLERKWENILVAIIFIRTEK
jgi:hypothetical protein